MAFEFLTTQEVAERLKVTVESVRTLCAGFDAGKSGGLPNYHFGEQPVESARRRSRHVKVEDLAAFIESRRTRPAQLVAQRQQIRETFKAAGRNRSKMREWV